MKGTFVALAFAAATQAFKIEKDAEIIAGLFTGITQEEGLTNLDGCIYGGDRFTMQIVHGVEMIIEFDLRSVISGTRSISRAVAGLPDMLSDCTHSTKDVEHLLSWATIFLRHDALVQRITANAMDNMARVSFDVLSARHAYKAEEWFKFGADVGRMLAFLTQPIDDDTLKVLLNQE